MNVDINVLSSQSSDTTVNIDTDSDSVSDCNESMTMTKEVSVQTDCAILDNFGDMVDILISRIKLAKQSLKEGHPHQNPLEISFEHLERITESIGDYLNVDIYRDIKSLQKIHLDIDRICAIKTEQYLAQRSRILSCFLKSLCKTERDQGVESSKRLYALCLAIEQIYFCRDLHFVGPFHASQSLTKWYFTGSKAAVQIEGTSTAACGITSLQKCVKGLADKNLNPIIPNDESIDVFSDNTQRICKTVRVRENATTPSSVITNVIYFRSNFKSKIQFDANLSPKIWMGKNDSNALRLKIIAEEKRLSEQYYKPFRKYEQKKLLRQILDEEKIAKSNKGLDHVSLKIEKDHVSVCSKCCTIFDVDAKICPKCKYNTGTFSSREDLYGAIPSGFPDSCKTEPIIGEILDMNPNSYDTISRVLVNIMKEAGVGTVREWVRVGFDGVPYRLAEDLIQNVVQCARCDDIFDSSSKKKIKNHSEHCVAEDHELKKIFQNLLLVTGSGHMEKNLILAIFTFLKDIMLGEVASKLGFRSPNAQKFIFGCGNHHVSWQICQILEQSIGLEIMYEYVQWCRSNGTDPTHLDFLKFEMYSVENKNHHMLYEIHRHLLLAVKCFRSGMRRNNSDYKIAGRQHLTPIMYFGKHFIYRRIIQNDMQIRVEAPPEVLKYIKENESFSASGDHYRGEGGDYNVETINKNIKHTLQPGLPTLQNWQTSARANRDLNKNRKSVYSRLSIPDPADHTCAIFNFSKEIQMVRAIIRSTGWIANPLLPKPLCSVTGNALHNDILGFYDKAESNYLDYLADNGSELKPLFLTEADEIAYNDSRNWTIKKIQQESENLLQLVCNDSNLALYTKMFKKTKKMKKDSQIAFYEELRSFIQMQQIESEVAVE